MTRVEQAFRPAYGQLIKNCHPERSATGGERSELEKEREVEGPWFYIKSYLIMAGAPYRLATHVGRIRSRHTAAAVVAVRPRCQSQALVRQFIRIHTASPHC